MLGDLIVRSPPAPTSSPRACPRSDASAPPKSIVITLTPRSVDAAASVARTSADAVGGQAGRRHRQGQPHDQRLAGGSALGLHASRDGPAGARCDGWSATVGTLDVQVHGPDVVAVRPTGGTRRSAGPRRAGHGQLALACPPNDEHDVAAGRPQLADPAIQLEVLRPPRPGV